MSKKLPEKLPAISEDNMFAPTWNKINELIDFLTPEKEETPFGNTAKGYGRVVPCSRLPESDWEKLESIFTWIELNHKDEVIDGFPMWKLKSYISKNFISKAVLVDRVEKMKVQGFRHDTNGGLSYDGYKDLGYNQAIIEILSLITNL